MNINIDMSFKCHVCQTEIKEVMTLVDMKIQVCSVQCLDKSTDGQGKLVITFPLNKRRYKVHKLNSYSNIDEKKYMDLGKTND